MSFQRPEEGGQKLQDLSACPWGKHCLLCLLHQTSGNLSVQTGDCGDMRPIHPTSLIPIPKLDEPLACTQDSELDSVLSE